MMLHIPAVLTKDEVRQLRQRLDAADWIDGRATVGSQGAQFKRNRQLPEHSPVSQELGRIVQKAVMSHPMFFAAALPARTMVPLFNRYEGSETYGAHVDGAVRGVPGADYRLRTDLSSTVFLSEPEDYDGGELIVHDTFGEHEVKLPAGDMVLYSSSSLHRVEPVTRGARVGAFFWTQSMIRDDSARTMLFTLDTTIQSLREKYGETPEAVALTAHYHNLLRRWAEP
ncbi:Fe2+-dependent dioxygenase [Pigmentiphaga soli]|uniref:Fe2+-dependent dioxygenase n=1 Tax=Pigmentiphaga soli TaxID=1007095 RepID=A0ABP8GIM0_9BURK